MDHNSLIKLGHIKVPREILKTFISDPVVLPWLINNFDQPRSFEFVQTSAGRVHRPLTQTLIGDIPVYHFRWCCGRRNGLKVLKKGIVLLVHPPSPPSRHSFLYECGSMLIPAKRIPSTNISTDPYTDMWATLITIPPFVCGNDCLPGSSDLGESGSPGRRPRVNPGSGRGERPCQQTRRSRLKEAARLEMKHATPAPNAERESRRSVPVDRRNTKRDRADTRSEVTMSCEDCGSQCHGQLCRDCELDERYSEAIDANELTTTLSTKCADCGRDAPDGSYDPDRPGVWTCDDCEQDPVNTQELIADGGTNELETAKIHLTLAINRSSKMAVTSTMDHLSTAASHLRAGGLIEMARVVEDIRDGDVTSPQTRYDLRQLASFVDSHLELDKEIDARVAFDGGNQ